jgi:tetratricopeptide (TPR) repeat protein
MVERLYKHLEEDPPDIRQFNLAVPDQLPPVLARMLAKKPEDRYQTPAELLEVLQNLKKHRLKREKAENRPPKSELQEESPPAPSSEALPVVPPQKTTTVDVPPERRNQASASTQRIPAVDQESVQLLLPNPEQQRAAAGQFARALEVLADGTHDYAIHLLHSCCKLEPTNLSYRQMLRRTEKAKYHQRGYGSRFAWLTTLAARARLKAARRVGQHIKVLEHGEQVLAQNPWDVGVQLDMAEAAETLGLLNLAIWLVEEARLKNIQDARVNRMLAQLYEKRGSYTQAIALWELVRKTDPTDMEASQKIRDLAANQTMARINRR